MKLIDVANAKADFARISNELENEKNNFLTKTQLLKSETESAHSSLAQLVSEKERLQIENKELSSVCEELMTLVEGND